jgi:hypothetical protein
VRNSPNGSLIHNLTFDLSDPDPSEDTLKRVSPLDNPRDGNNAIEVVSAAKRQFLTSGMLLTPESPKLDVLISNIQVQFHNLHYLLNTLEKLEAAKNLFVRRDGGGNAEFHLLIGARSPVSRSSKYTSARLWMRLANSQEGIYPRHRMTKNSIVPLRRLKGLLAAL